MPELTLERPRAGVRPAASILTAALAWSCGMIHLQAAADHVDESLLYAVLFVLLAALQIGWGGMMLRGAGTRFAMAGVAVNLVAICVWSLSRVWALPGGGEDATGGEPLGLLDVLATLDELVMVTLALGTLPRLACRLRRVRAVVPPLATVLLLASCLVLASGVHAH